MASGYVTSLIDRKGFGFIAVQPGTKDAIFFPSELRGDLEFCPQLQGRRVTFEIKETSRGLQAINVRPAA